MPSELVFHEKIILKHQDPERQGIFERDETIFGFDNHKPKGPHLHIGEQEVGYVFRGLKALKEDIIAMIKKEGFIYED